MERGGTPSWPRCALQLPELGEAVAPGLRMLWIAKHLTSP
jgi:hypothetical protein